MITRVLKAYSQLTKTGIIVFSIVSAWAGYALSFEMGQEFSLVNLFVLGAGIYFVAAGAFALNQAQEWKLDGVMPRTQKRPIPQGVFKPWQGYLVSAILIALGLLFLSVLSELTAVLALATIVLYNGVYTLLWKRRWAFGAVPGAIPGALPVVIGFSANTNEIWRPECVYMFLIMFLWQMPHFWSLAIRFKDDYEKGGVPVLPVRLGTSRTMYHIGLYVFAYVGVAVMAPWYLNANLMYVLLVLPISAKLVWEFIKYYRAFDRASWLPFFMWTNLSLLVYLAVPVMDKWIDWVFLRWT